MPLDYKKKKWKKKNKRTVDEKIRNQNQEQRKGKIAKSNGMISCAVSDVRCVVADV